MKLTDIAKRILFERYINLKTKTELSKYIDVIWDLIQKSYEGIGGYLAADSKEDLLNKVGFAKLFKYDDKIIAVALYKDSHGKKAIGKAQDGSKLGKDIVKRIIIDDVLFNRSWGEFSGTLEHLYLKAGGIKIPNSRAAELTGKKIETLDPDGYHYERIINGKLVRKIIIGNLK